MIGLPWRAVQCSPLAAWVRAALISSCPRPASSFSPAAFSPGFITRTLVLSSSPSPPCVTTRCADLDAGDDLHHLRLAHADLHHLLVRDVLVVDDEDDGLALGVGQDRRRRNQRRALERRRDDRDVHRLSGVQPLARVVGLHPDLHRRAVGVGRRADDGDPAGDQLAAVGRRDRRLVADLHVPRLVLRHVDARDDLRHVHHGEQRRAGGGHLARVERTVGDDAGRSGCGSPRSSPGPARSRSGPWPPRPARRRS